ncbi:tyrosinase [Hirsutella rhossiliensis]|uniref:Tyrosinase n=1 Tax=Hirsutella rhossiliensis TaxID=111463 RepID=A0A9P8N9L3_9HYPO|nr:tyrosinase [Hirsutella rhossiliensis]KAH0967137.1 tyrosinase [Hirsutella rhossiliensis]
MPQLLPGAQREHLTYAVTADLLSTTSVHGFRLLLENTVHQSSHGYVGGDGFDFYSSPNDLDLYLLHAQIDRLWIIWGCSGGKPPRARMPEARLINHRTNAHLLKG